MVSKTNPDHTLPDGLQWHMGVLDPYLDNQRSTVLCLSPIVPSEAMMPRGHGGSSETIQGSGIEFVQLNGKGYIHQNLKYKNTYFIALKSIP